MRAFLINLLLGGDDLAQSMAAMITQRRRAITAWNRSLVIAARLGRERNVVATAQQLYHDARKSMESAYNLDLPL